MQPSQRAAVRYEVDRVHEDWTLPEESVPESRPHELASDLLKLLLLAWAARERRNAQVGRHLAVRWDEAHPNIGVDPDVYVVEPPPPEGDNVSSLRLWESGHVAPLLAVEVVSPNNAEKDYTTSPNKYAASGVQELWIFDPQLAGPKSHGGPFRIQLWERDEDGTFTRTYAGAGPVRSPAIGGWLFAVDEGRLLRIASDEGGTSWWMTQEEAERAAKEAERAAKEAALADKDALARRVAELEALLAKQGGGG